MSGAALSGKSKYGIIQDQNDCAVNIMADIGGDAGFKVLRRVEWKSGPDGARPDVSFLPMLERRRLTAVERAALHAAWKVFHGEDSACGSLPPANEVPVVFSSRWGEIGITYKLMRQMHSEGEMSPAGFSSSVHNAAPGAWSLFTGNKTPYTAISARGRSYEMGLIEAKAQLAAGTPHVLYVYAEEATPEDYLPSFGKPVEAHSIAMLLARSPETEGLR